MLKLSTNVNDAVWIDNKHRVFADSEYADYDFRIQIKPISRVDIARINKKHTTRKKGVPTTNDIAAQADQFVECVLTWENILDGEGNPIECNTENKQNIANVNALFAANVVDAAGSIILNNEDDIKN